MYRIDNLTAIPYLPTTPPSAAPGFFTDGNPAAALEATVVDAWWLNQLQEEILTVTGAAGIAPDKGRHTQLFEALEALYQRNGVIGNYLPLAGGSLSGFLTLHANPTFEMHAATKLYVDQVMGGIIIPPVGDYLPLTGGTLYRPGGSDFLQMLVDEGQSARMLFNVLNTRMWGIGTNADGTFEIGDWNIGGARLVIDAVGMVAIHGSLWVGGPFSAASGDIPGNLVVGGDLHMPSGGSAFISGGVSVGQNLNAEGDIAATGSLRGWAAIVQSDVLAGGSLTSQGATISGLTHTDRLLTNNDATIGTTLLVNGFATISGAATISGVLRANGNRILSYGGNNPTLAMVNAGAAPGYGMWVGGNPGRLTIGTVDTAGNPLANLVYLNMNGTFNVLGALEVGGGINANGGLNIGGQCHFHSDLQLNGQGTFNGTFRTGSDAIVGNNLVVSGTANFNAGATVAYGLSVGQGISIAAGGATIVGNVSVSNNFGVGGASDLSGPMNLYNTIANKLGGGPWLDLYSDSRVKKAVQPYEAGLAEIGRLRPISYEYNGLAGTPDDGTVLHGLIAQDAVAVMPEMATAPRRMRLAADDAEETDIMGLDTGPITFALVNAVQELSARLEALETRRTT